MERILLRFDGDAAAWSAVAWVAHRARRRRGRSRITLMLDGPARDAAALGLALAAQSLRDAVPGTVVRAHGPLPHLTGHGLDADLVVLGVPSDATRMAAHVGGHGAHDTGSRAPVCIVPAGWRPTAGPVTVGVDGDASSDAAVRFAAREAANLGVPLTLVHSWLMRMPAPDSFPTARPDPRSAEAGHLTILRAAARRVPDEHPPRADLRLIRDTPSSALSAFEDDASMIVIGTHRARGAVDLRGSVARDLMAELRRPLCVVPPSP